MTSDDLAWWPAGPGRSPGLVSVVTVSYNTRELTAFLLWSLRTVVDWPELEIVVVDNGSQDGSAELLAEAARAGVCVLLANQVNRQHGPGLNQAISWLAARPGPRPGWLWILDSDAVAARPDALSAAVANARDHAAALVGGPQADRWHQDGRFGMYSLLLDPEVVWHPPAAPFTDGGDPSLDLLTTAARLGIAMAAFPFTAGGHVIHRGRGSLAAVHAAGDRAHPLYDWAAGHHAPHFGNIPGAEQRYRALLQAFRTETGPLTGATLVAACGYPPEPAVLLGRPGWLSRVLAWPGGRPPGGLSAQGRAQGRAAALASCRAGSLRPAPADHRAAAAPDGHPRFEFFPLPGELLPMTWEQLKAPLLRAPHPLR